MPNTKSRPGRPLQHASPDSRQAIILAASRHFAKDGIKGSSNRQIALAASVTPALVHYYFKNRDALFCAVLETGFEPLICQLSDLVSLPQWVEAFHAHLLSKPWLPHLMTREVFPANGQLRQLFLEHQAPILFGSLRPLVAALTRKSRRHNKPDTDRHVMLLMGMLVYPFLSMEVAQNLTGRKFDHAMLEGFRDDTLSMFLTGLSA